MPQVSASLSGRDHDAPDHPGPDAHDRAAPDSYSPDAYGRDTGAQPAPAERAGGQETLDRYAAAGGMAPERIRRILADLVPALEILHRAGRAHGDIAPSTIGLDASGRARLLTPPLVPAANAEDAPRRDGYAAFEQHSDDPDTPCGPWTDIYALSATACALLTGLAPPPALARCVRDDYVPLTRRRGQDEQAFCAVLDSGLALDAYARPQTIGEFARALRLDLSPPVVKPSVVETPPAGRQSMLEDADGLEATSAWRSAQATSGGNPAQGMAAAAAATAPADASISARPDAARNTSHDAAPATSQPESQVALYREGQEPARDRAAVEYEAAVAAMHQRPDPQPSQAGRAQVPPAEKAPLWKPGPQRQRAPLLMILAVIVMVAAAFYMWLRPQPSSRANIIASTSNAGSGASRTPTSNGATGNASNSATANGANGTMTTASNGATGNAQNSATGTAPGGAPANTASGAAGNAAGSTSSYASNSVPAGTDAAASQAAGDSVSPGAMAMNPGISGTAGGAPSGATPLTPGAAPTASSSTSVASSSPAAPGPGNQGLTTQTLPNQTINMVDLDKSGAGKSPTGTGTNANTAGTAIAAAGPNATPADAATKARATSKTPVAVAIAVRPWGEILVNGKSRGVSPPLNSVTLAPGTYDITIRNNAGPDVHQSLTVTAGRASTISHTFN